MKPTLRLFAVEVSYRRPKKRKGFDAIDWITKTIGTFIVKDDEHEAAAQTIAEWLVECKSEAVKYPNTIEIDVTQHDNKPKKGIQWSTNGDGAVSFRVHNEYDSIQVYEKPL